MCLGAVILVILLLPFLSSQDSFAYAQAFALLVLVYTLIVIDRRAKNMRSPLADYLIDSLERKGAPPAHGAMWYAIGALIALTFIPNPAAAAATIFIMAIADGISTLVGIKGTHALPHNKKKTLEGSAAFFIVGLGAYAFIGFLAVPFSLLGAITESLDFRLDDNLTVPLVCVAFFKLAGL